MINRLLTPADLNNGVFDAVYKHFEQIFPPDESRARKTLTFDDAGGQRTIKGLEELIIEPNLEYSKANFLCMFEEGIKLNHHEAFRGGLLFYIFPEHGFAFVEYIFVSEGHRKRGHGRGLLEGALKNYMPSNINRLFAEVEREIDFSNKEEIKTVKERLRFFESVGFFPLLTEYIQPNYSSDKKPVLLHPMLNNLDGKKGIIPKEFINFMQVFYQDIYGLPSKNSYFDNIKNPIKGHEIIEQRKPQYTHLLLL